MFASRIVTKNMVSNIEVAKVNALLSSTPLPSRPVPSVHPLPLPSLSPLRRHPSLPSRHRHRASPPSPVSPSQAPDRRDVIPLLCARASPSSLVGRVPIDGATARSGRGELQSTPPPHDLAAGRSTCSKPQIDATPSHWATASCPRPSAVDTAARGSSAAGDGGLDAFL
jgi:hypothetical protein